MHVCCFKITVCLPCSSSTYTSGLETQVLKGPDSVNYLVPSKRSTWSTGGRHKADALPKMHCPLLHKYTIEGMPSPTYFAGLFKGICVLLLMSLVHETFKGRHKDRQRWGTSPAVSFNKHIKRKAYDRCKPLLHLLSWCRKGGREIKTDRWIVTGSEKIVRGEIFEPSTSHSLGLNDRWRISTAATQIQREGGSLSD